MRGGIRYARRRGGRTVKTLNPAMTWRKPHPDLTVLRFGSGDMMSIHLSSPLEPMTILLIVSNVVVWSLHLFLRRQIGNLLHPK